MGVGFPKGWVSGFLALMEPNVYDQLISPDLGPRSYPRSILLLGNWYVARYG